MCLLFESIKIKYGKAQNIDYHLKRVKKSRSLLFGYSDVNDFLNFLNDHKIGDENLFKLKIIYNKNIVDYQLMDYTINQKKSIKFFERPNLDYSFKYYDRDKLEEIELQLSSDEVGIITKNGYLTDATYANIVLFDGKNYFTPENCLLEGTKRAKLLKEGKISTKLIHINDLDFYKHLQIINSMIDLEDDVKIKL